MHFVEDIFTEKGYLHFLEKHIIPRITEILMTFQQDGVPSHFNQQLPAYLDRCFPGR